MAEKLLDPSFERLLQRGPGALTDTEIVSLLLGNRDSRIASLEQARIFLDLFGGSIPGLLACNVAITKAQMLEPGPAANLLAAIELGRRLRCAPQLVDLSTDPDKAASAFLLQIGTTDQEVLGANFADADNRKVGFVECFRGTMFDMVIDSKTILREALCRNACGIHLCHFLLFSSSHWLSLRRLHPW